jgi:glycosidase
MHSLYRELLALRHDREVLRRGSIEFAPTDDGIIRFDRVLDDARLTVLVNLGETAVPWPDDLAEEEVVISSDSSRVRAGGHLAPAEAVVVDRRAVPRSG